MEPHASSRQDTREPNLLIQVAAGRVEPPGPVVGRARLERNARESTIPRPSLGRREQGTRDATTLVALGSGELADVRVQVSAPVPLFLDGDDADNLARQSSHEDRVLLPLRIEGLLEPRAHGRSHSFGRTPGSHADTQPRSEGEDG